MWIWKILYFNGRFAKKFLMICLELVKKEGREKNLEENCEKNKGKISLCLILYFAICSSPLDANKGREYFETFPSVPFISPCSKQNIGYMTIVEMDGLIGYYLPNQLQNLALRKILKIYHCYNLMVSIDNTEAAFNGWTSLQHLYIRHCPELLSLPKELLQPTLEDIRLNGCPKLNTPNPDALCSLTSVKNLEVVDCPILRTCWEEGLVCSTSIQSLHIGRFREESTYFPWPSKSAATPWCHFTSLEILSLFDDGWEDYFESLPDQLEHLPALTSLELRFFYGLKSLPDWLGNLSSLQRLRIADCPHLSDRCKEGGDDWHKIAHIPFIIIDSWYRNL